MNLHPSKLRNQLRISVSDVRIGMFIAELDRPWAETPFMLQGFLLKEAAHLQMLRDFVSEVMIDPTRSATDSFTHLPWDALHEPVEIHTPAAPIARTSIVYTTSPAINEDKPLFTTFRQRWRNIFDPTSRGDTSPHQPAPYYLRFAEQQPDSSTDSENDQPLSETERKAALTSKLTPPSTPQFSKFIESTYPLDVNFAPLSIADRIELFRSKLSKSGPAILKPQKPAIEKLPQKKRPNFVPASIPLVIYRDQTTIKQELVRAKKTVRHADKVLKKMMNSIQADLPIRLDDVKPVVEVLVESIVSNPTALMWSAKLRDESKKAYMHGLKVAIYMMALGRHLGFPKEQLSELGTIGLLIDIGMLKIPTALLEKVDELTPEEYALLTQHVMYGMQTLEQGSPLPHNIARGILEHHERIDGSGYPQGLKGESISIYGQIAAIADTFAAMTTERLHDVTHSAFDAMKELFKEAETKLHAPLVEQFVHAISIFPVGSLIELSSGEVAIVLEHNKIRRLEPKVLILTNSDKEMLAQPVLLDLMAKNKSNSEKRKILRGLPDGAYDINYRDYYLS
ncbi:MAG TPA: HD-GYP domain-containing protein [Burkholderiaceae bacterium]|jgi:HD-GYP domain-containing protein (c-di-GMP phosphodiesterase class II)